MDSMHTHAPMTGRERVQAAMEGRDHDRVPRYESFWTDTIARWNEEGTFTGGMDDARDLLASDMHYLSWCWPTAFGGEEVLDEDDETWTVRDMHGKIVRTWKKRSGTPEHIGFGCQTRDDWEKTYKPLLLREGLRSSVPEAVKRWGQAQTQQRWSFLAGVEGFEGVRCLIGDEVAMIAMIEDPQWIYDISETYADLILTYNQRLLDAGVKPDGFWLYGDMAYNHATFCSPQMYRELIWPSHKRLCAWAHEKGMKFIYHTDGDVRGVMDLYLEAGFDSLQPLEAKANMDIRKLAPVYGDRMTFFGNIDVMIMGANDLEKLEAEVRSKLEAGMATRRYLYHSDHSVPPSCDFATWRHVIDLLDRYGNY